MGGGIQGNAGKGYVGSGTSFVMNIIRITRLVLGQCT